MWMELLQSIIPMIDLPSFRIPFFHVICSIQHTYITIHMPLSEMIQDHSYSHMSNTVMALLGEWQNVFLLQSNLISQLPPTLKMPQLSRDGSNWLILIFSGTIFLLNFSCLISLTNKSACCTKKKIFFWAF